MNFNSKNVLLTVLVSLAIVAFFSGIFVWRHAHSNKKIDSTQFNGTYLQNPRTINEFVLSGTDGQVFNNDSLKGQWTLMFFGFTQCGYLCPTTMAEFAKMYRILQQQGVKNLPRIVMVSIDPERDTVEKINHYVKAFHEDFFGARGDEKLIKAMTREMGVAYTKVLSKDSSHPNQYDLEHSGAVIVFNPQGELNAFFTTPHHASVLAKDYIMLVS